MSPNPSDEYFADGMTEELISTMSKISGLRVIARTSVMAYKGERKKIDEVARELEVGTILEGSVRTAGGKLRITVQLIDSRTSEHLWSESYDRELRDVFAIQSEISEKVARALKVRLLAEERARIKKAPSRNVEAHISCLRGINLVRSGWTETDTRKAIEHFERAIELDPTYAEAYSWLSNCYVGISPTLMGLTFSPSEAIPKAEAAVGRAIELEPDLADAHLALGQLLKLKLDWKGAEREMRKALELNPGVPGGHSLYAWTLASMGRLDDALVEANKALELDPVSPDANDAAAIVHGALRDYDKAIEYWERMRECGADPRFVSSRLGWAYLGKSQFDRALEEWEKAGTDIAIGYAMVGRTEEARRLLKGHEEWLSQNGFVHAWGLVEMHLALGENEEAIAALQRSYDEGRNDAFTFGLIKILFLCDPIRSDPRVVALLKKIGLD